MNKTESLFLMLKQNNSIPHCVILQGMSESISLTADFIGRLILCGCKANSDKFLSCNCPSCIKFKAHSHPDLVYITGKETTNSILVDAIRFIKKDAYIVPTEGENKVYIIKNAQNMTRQAQNAVLKIFEEPPKGVYFIMTCQNANSLLQTICSRAQIYSVDEPDELVENNEAYDIARNIVLFALADDMGRVLLETSRFYKNKNLFEAVLEQTESILGKLIRGEKEKIFDCTEKKIQINPTRLIFLYDAVSQTKVMLGTNVNLNLLCAYFASRLSEI